MPLAGIAHHGRLLRQVGGRRGRRAAERRTCDRTGVDGGLLADRVGDRPAPGPCARGEQCAFMNKGFGFCARPCLTQGECSSGATPAPAAFRDVAAFFRNALADGVGTPNPVGGQVSWVITRGSSQSGNFIRALLHLGFTVDDANRKVYDGAWPMIAGRRVALNFRFAMPDGVRRLSSRTRNSPLSSRIRSMPDTCTRTPFGGRTLAASRWKWDEVVMTRRGITPSSKTRPPRR